MTRPNHTSGPWRIGDAGHTIFGPPTGEPAPQRIADLAPVDRKANARLIAAAPEMLDALRELVEYLDDYCAEEDFDSDTANAARAVIRKATGGE